MLARLSTASIPDLMPWTPGGHCRYRSYIQNKSTHDLFKAATKLARRTSSREDERPQDTGAVNMAGMVVGYARTSTIDQHAGIEAQNRDLVAAGCEKVFCEQVSSVAERVQLKTCLSFLREGDALVVSKPDRLARSTGDLLAIEADLTKRGIGLVVQSMGLKLRAGGLPSPPAY
jgi:predicted site-specific integrase-resolvase